MKQIGTPSYKTLCAGVFLLCLFSINVLSVMVVAQLNTSSIMNDGVDPIRIVQTQFDHFKGVNSIMVQTSTSSLGVLFGTATNAFPLSIFTDFTQKLAEIEFQNRRGTVINRSQLRTRNTFLMRLVKITEYDNVGIDSKFNSTLTSPSIKKVIDLSTVRFKVNASKTSTNESESDLSYHLDFSANDIPYRFAIPTSKLDFLNISFDFEVEKSQVTVPTIPKIRIRSDGNRIEVSRTVSTQSIDAIRFAPRLKFSCNISGWDFSSSTSQLALQVDFFTHEEILGLASKIGDTTLSRELLKQTDLLGEFKFSTLQNGQSQDHILDQSTVQIVNYTANSFNYNRFSLGNSLRDFLNFSWAENVNVDGSIHPVTFQPLSSEALPMALSPSLSPEAKTIVLRGGFILPQGDNIYYDPEVQLEELNPIFKILPPPNRVILESSSQIIMISGFFVGILIIIRQRFLK